MGSQMGSQISCLCEPTEFVSRYAEIFWDWVKYCDVYCDVLRSLRCVVSVEATAEMPSFSKRFSPASSWGRNNGSNDFSEDSRPVNVFFRLLDQTFKIWNEKNMFRLWKKCFKMMKVLRWHALRNSKWCALWCGQYVAHRHLRRNESLGAVFFQVRVSRLVQVVQWVPRCDWSHITELVCSSFARLLRRLVCAAGFAASQSSEATELSKEQNRTLKESKEPEVLGEAVKRWSGSAWCRSALSMRKLLQVTFQGWWICAWSSLLEWSGGLDYPSFHTIWQKIDKIDKKSSLGKNMSEPCHRPPTGRLLSILLLGILPQTGARDCQGLPGLPSWKCPQRIRHKQRHKHA